MNSITRTKTKPVIIDPEKQTRARISKPAHFVVQLDFEKLEGSDKKSFLVVPIETLTKYLPMIRASVKMLRVVFVLDKKQGSIQKVDALLDKIVQTNSEKILSKLFVTERFDDINRILHAWCDGVESSTIAEAWIDGDRLIVKTCALERLSIAFEQLPWLAKIAKEERGNFEIDSFGNYINWAKQDVHIDVNAIRCSVDANFRKKRDIELITKNTAYGQAIAKFRAQSGLSQQEIMRRTGITDRQLRRIERQGHPLSVQMVKHLAQAHELSENDYLNAIAVVLQSK